MTELKSTEQPQQPSTSKRIQLSSLYNQRKHKLIHSLLPSSKQAPAPATVTVQPPSQPASPELSALVSPTEPFNSNDIINQHFTQSIPNALNPTTTAATSSSSAASAEITDTQLEDGPLLRAQLTQLEQRATQLRSSIKPLIKVFESIHINLKASLEADTQLDLALDLLDETTPACFRPLKDIYHQSAKIQNRAIDQERQDRLESQVLEPLRRMHTALKDIPQKKKTYIQHVKSYDETLQKYLSIKTEGENEIRKKEQMKARVDYGRICYHHWIYEQAVFQETEVLSILTEYVLSEHMCRRSSLTGTVIDPADTIGKELISLRQELAIQYIQRETKRRVMEKEREISKNQLNDSFQSNSSIGITPDATYSTRNHSHSNGVPQPKAKLMSRSTSAFEQHFNLNSNHSRNRTHEKLKGFAYTLTGKTFQSGNEEDDAGNSNDYPTSNDSGDNSGDTDHIISSLSLMNLFVPVSSTTVLPSTSTKESIESEELGKKEKEEDDQLALDPRDKGITNNNENPRKREGFLLSCTKSLTAGRGGGGGGGTPTRQNNTMIEQEIPQGTGGGIPNGEAIRNWKKVWCKLDSSGLFQEFRGDLLDELYRPDPIDLRFAMVRKRIGKSERKFSFEIVTPKSVRVFQAFSEFDLLNWLNAIESTIEFLLNCSVSAKMKSRLTKPLGSVGGEHNEQAQTTTPKKSSRTTGKEKYQGLSVGSSRLQKLDRRSSSSLISALNNKSIGKRTQNRAATLDYQQQPGSEGTQWSKDTLSTDWVGEGMAVSSLSTSLDDHPQGVDHEEEDEVLQDSPMRSRSSTTIGDHDRSHDHLLVPTSGRAFINGEEDDEHDDEEDSDEEEQEEDEEESGDIEENDEDEQDEIDRIHSRNWNELDKLSHQWNCAECGKPKPRWSSYSLGILICINCSGIHRGLGTHISKVRSLDLDDWNDDHIRNIILIGNIKSKQIWEARLPPNFKLTNSNIKQFIHDKYVEKKYLN
ncbi:hypothetical protein Pst134EA_020825 [Puccinia striiformis f. sp. tritici]|uniref:Arf-GAP domain-containing protein n=1 Tax=Puccinia striiformis TaxID=27350 RepID=A0A2S4VCE6_9BASI|nr:hypothetical protein Pst134EA_020825 [Puccinia striiformis f. sp. tritici]KAH9456918.1 hypothetical protein Pst134EA_020825 [Puccinia striiformis f. sp. tritici]KAI9620233.1 hypothetical protein H4Q26_013802 [Puccinia striiformis f. sp. tritici PST-130]POW07110.1 hypothetical protein PSTT_08488 [Puccinia striiformis]